MMYHVEYQETQERRFATLFLLLQPSIWFRAVLFERSEVKDHLSPNSSWTGVWSYSSWLIHSSCPMQFHPTFTTLKLASSLFNKTWPLTWHTCSPFLYLLHTGEKQFTNWHHAVSRVGFGSHYPNLILAPLCVTWAIYFSLLCLSFLISEMVPTHSMVPTH